MKKTIIAASAALILAASLSACNQQQPQQVAYVPPVQQPVYVQQPAVVQPVAVVQPGYSSGDLAAAAMLGVAAGSMFNYGGHYYAHDPRGYYYMDHGRRYYDPRPPYSVTHHNYTVTNVTVNKTVAAPAAPQVVQPTKIAQPINLAKAPTPAPTFRPVAARPSAPAPIARASFRPSSARSK